MTDFKIRQSSPWLTVATILIVIFVGMAIIITLSANHVFPDHQPLIFILGFPLIFGVTFYLPRYTATADIEILIGDEGLKRTWLRQFIFHHKKDDEFRWNEIENYVFQPDRQFDQFKLKVKDGRKFGFYHNNDHDGKDDFKKLLFYFSEKVNQHNKASIVRY